MPSAPAAIENAFGLTGGFVRPLLVVGRAGAGEWKAGLIFLTHHRLSVLTGAGGLVAGLEPVAAVDIAALSIEEALDATVVGLVTVEKSIARIPSLPAFGAVFGAKEPDE